MEHAKVAADLLDCPVALTSIDAESTASNYETNLGSMQARMQTVLSHVYDAQSPSMILGVFHGPDVQNSLCDSSSGVLEMSAVNDAVKPAAVVEHSSSLNFNSVVVCDNIAEPITSSALIDPVGEPSITDPTGDPIHSVTDTRIDCIIVGSTFESSAAGIANNEVGGESSEQVDSDSLPSTDSSSSSSDSEESSDEFGGYTVNPVHVDSDDDDDDNNSIHDDNDDYTAVDDATRAERTRRKRVHGLRHHLLLTDNEPTDTDSDDDADSDNVAVKSSRLDGLSLETKMTLPLDPWRPLTEVCLRQFGGGRKRLTSAVFEKRVGGSVNMANRLTLYAKHELHEGCVNALHFNQSGSLIASGSDDLQVVIFDWIHSKTFINFESGHRSNVFQAKFLPHTGDCHIVTCARDGQVRLAQLSTTGVCKGTKLLASHKMAAHKLALLNDSPHMFYSCGEDAVVYRIDLRENRPTKCYTTKENDRKIALYSIHSNPLNSFEHCVGGCDQYIRVYDARMFSDADDGNGLVKKFCPHHLVTSDFKAHVTCAVYNYNGTEIVGSYNDEDIYLFDNSHSDGAEHIHKYTGHRNNATVKGINFYGPCSEFVISGSDCGHVFIWHRDTEKVVNFFAADDGGVVNVLEPHPSLPLLATSGLDNDVKFWLPTAQEPAALDNLSKVIQKNQKEREDERNEPDVIDSQMLWFLMHTLRRNAARRAAEEGGAARSGLFGQHGDSDNLSADSDAEEGGAGGGDTDSDSDDTDRSHCTTS